MTSKPIMMAAPHSSEQAAAAVLRLKGELNRGNFMQIAGKVASTVDVAPNVFPNKIFAFGRAHLRASKIDRELTEFSEFLHDVKKDINDNHVSVREIKGKLDSTEVLDDITRAVCLRDTHNTVPAFVRSIKMHVEAKQGASPTLYSAELPMDSKLLLLANTLLKQEMVADREESLKQIFMTLRKTRSSLIGQMDLAIGEMKKILGQIAFDLRRTAAPLNFLGC